MKRILLIVLFLPSFVFAQGKTEKQRSSSEFLRTRQQAISYRLEYVDGSSGSASSQMTTVAANYAYNFGYFEVGFGSALISQTNGGVSQTSSLLMALAQWNFIENKPSNQIIPYFGIGGGLAKLSQSGVSKIDLSSSPFAYGLGFLWFPFQEIFAVNISYFRMQQSWRSASSGAGVDATTGTMTIGWSLYY